MPKVAAVPRVRSMILAVSVGLILVACGQTVDAAPEGLAARAPTTDSASSSHARADARASTTSTSTPSTTSTTMPTPEPRFTYGPGGQPITWLADQAALAILAELPEGSTTIDLSGRPLLADRVAIGLVETGIAFTRSNTPDETGSYGTVISLHDAPEAAIREWPRRATNSDPSALNVRRESVAAFRGEDLIHSREVTVLDSENWLIAESAPPNVLALDIPDEPRSVVAWSNREAQRYVAENVEVTSDRVIISTASRTTTPSISELPFDSGMAISTNDFGWGTFAGEVTVPTTPGLWPALWLLSSEACEGAGRCSGFATSAFHEIDILETDGTPTAHTTVHWWDDVHRSTTATAPLAPESLGTASNLQIELERRPGLLVWHIDGVVVHVVTGRVDSFETGPHQSGPMMLLANTAVGGTFAGSREIGRNGVWLGEAIVPDSYPNLLHDTLTIRELSFAEL